jgi:hypothetical protein
LDTVKLFHQKKYNINEDQEDYRLGLKLAPDRVELERARLV